ncbi:VIT1/CCC1 transporter family protein [Fodinisporobacter ferrooxydans]|uniref:VIT1/CCC1 transporter family protein n=1 Tax=Fodinisporobacter ferrooxydans TaxID=2901836 RepID=A0ABY4CI42_9BACL|nr:VIT1/CCC1 transporter family protein [Alicyclobacillaceae bacterium MYW30-H2]
MIMESNLELKKKLLIENWRREMEAVQLYELAAKQESNHKKHEILLRLAQIEKEHAVLWEKELGQLGYDVSQLPVIQLPGHGKTTNVLKQLFDIEQSNARWYQSQRNLLSDESDVLRIIDKIEADEAEHETAVESITRSTPSVSNALNSIWGKERWHKQHTGDWVGDAIYGVNDGLGAIFGIIAGVAGFTSDSHTILISGFFGALASTLSMGAGAWLATKSENELMETELQHERREVEEDPEHEKEELALLYELKGFSQEESKQIADRIATDPEQFVKAMAQEELGIHESTARNPWTSALYGCISTFIGAIVPLLPFFFLSGVPAMVTAAIVSILAHFAVGAAKSLITVRNWWSSGIEMTAAGIIVGVVSYGLGLLGTLIVHL